MIAETSKNNHRKAVLTAIIGTSLLPAGDSICKLIIELGYPPYIISFIRYVAVFILLIPVIPFYLKHIKKANLTFLKFCFFRSTFLLIASFFFFSSLQYNSVAVSVSIFLIEPLFLIILSRIFLKEKIGIITLLAITLGFASSIILIQPSFSIIGVSSLWALGAAFFFAIYILFSKKISETSQPSVVVEIFTALFGTLISIPLVSFIDLELGLKLIKLAYPLHHYVIFFLLGIVFSLGHFLILKSLKVISANLQAPIQYFEIFSANLFSWLVAHEQLTASNFIGMSLIVLSGVILAVKSNLERKIKTAFAKNKTKNTGDIKH